MGCDRTTATVLALSSCVACLWFAIAKPVGAQGPMEQAYTYVEAGGIVSAEAESYTRRGSAASGRRWTVIPDESAGAGPPVRNPRGGRYLQLLPDVDVAAGAPFVEYDLKISTPGLYRLFVRWDGNSTNSFSAGGSDSVFVRILQLKDGTGGAIADWYELQQGVDGDFGNPGWDGDGGFEQTTAVPVDGPVTWDIGSAGTYTLQFYMREDGAAIDAFVFQLVALAPPAGLGPPISATEVQATPVEPIDAIEFHHSALDHYFVSADPIEITALHNGVHAGWKPTGHILKAYAAPADSLRPVCRFYIPPAIGDSHFYSASPQECDETRAKFPQFVYETPSAMYAALPGPTSGACAEGLTPVYRLWNKRADSNHRYTTDRALRDAMAARGYVPEGYGSDGVAMCAGQQPEGIHGWQFEHERDRANARLPYHYNVVKGPEHPVRFGASSQRFEERSGDCYTTDCTRADGAHERSEVSQIGYLNDEGEEFWYGLSFFVPVQSANANYMSYFQFFPRPPPGEPWWSKGEGPSFQFVKQKDRDFRITSYSEPGPYHVIADSVISASEFFERWHDVVMHIRWSAQADGFLRMWVNGSQRVDFRGATIPTTYRIGGLYFKYGVYGASTSVVRVAYFDEVRRGRSREEVDIRHIEAATRD